MKELIVGKATEKDMADVGRLSGQENQARAQLQAAASALIQHGVQLRQWFTGLEKRHRLEHGHNYRVKPNADIVKLIPEQPPIDNAAGEHCLNIKFGEEQWKHLQQFAEKNQISPEEAVGWIVDYMRAGLLKPPDETPVQRNNPEEPIGPTTDPGY